MQATIIKTCLVVLLMGITPAQSQSKQSNTPQEKPWYLGDGVIGAVAAFIIGSAGSALWGGSKKVSEAEKQSFKSEFKKEIEVFIDQKIADNEKIKELESKLILQDIKNSIVDLTKEIQNMNRNFDNHKLSMIRRFEAVEKQVDNQQRNSDGIVERVNLVVQNAFGEFGVTVPTIKTRGNRNSKQPTYETDGGIISPGDYRQK